MLFPEVEKYIKRDSFFDDTLRLKVLNFLEKLYSEINTDKEMHNWCRCKDNRYEDLYDAFIEKAEKIITPTKENNVYSDEFRMYNLLHNESFYNIWTNDVLRLLIYLKQGKV